MKILHITASYKPAYIYGGPIQSVGKLCESLVKGKEQKAESLKPKAQSTEEKERLINLQVFTTTANGLNELNVAVNEPILIDGVPVTYFKRLTKDHSHFSPSLLWELRKEILRCAQDDKKIAQDTKPIIHIHAWWNLVSVFSCFVAKWYKVPVVLSPRGMLTSYTQYNRNTLAKRIIHSVIGKRLLKYCHIHATSEQEKEDILRIVRPKNITVIPNLVNVAYQVSGIEYQVSSIEYRVSSIKYQEELKAESIKAKAKSWEQKTGSREQGYEKSSFKLIFLSRIEEKKGLDLLFDALALLNIDWTLTIAGSGDDIYVESLKRKAESLKLSSRINWIGQVSNEDKFEIISQHDLLVLTSYNENFANVVIESLSVGTPVMLSEKVGLSDYIKANELGWVCNLNPNDITEKINESYHNQLKRKEIRSIAPNLIREDFNDEVLAAKYLDLYEKILRLRSA
ncbi:XrtY-associated glycosyltransferase XYAG1 [Pedobacter aquatilis]|uniref:XrtY-associated glycosyltransferase XYAG1 n=1 Tax=Pedobacter aquatilis TaxID=351343 RepID=UPI00292E8182|nr:glycosyltransferase [Pedobacter aquatilis]